jgi:hypothetical protein
MRNTVKLSVPIVCLDCRAVGGDTRPRALGGVVVFADDTCIAWYASTRRSRHAHEHRLTPEIFPTYGQRRSRVRDRFVLDPGARIEVPCGRTHHQPDGTLGPTIVAIDDDAAGAALWHVGIDPARVRRLSGAEIEPRREARG